MTLLKGYEVFMVDHEAGANFMPSLADVTAAYSSVTRHNAVNVGFGAVFGAMLDVVEREDNAERTGASVPVVEEVLEQAKVAGDMEGELQGVLYADMFATAGIDVMSVGSVGSKQRTSAKLVPVVRNTTLFTEFLAGIAPEEMHSDDSHRKLPDDVLGTLRELVVASVTVKNDDPDEKARYDAFAEDSLRTFLAIDSEYRRLGIDNSVHSYSRDYKDLDGYATYWGRGVLAEHIQIGSSAFLSEPKTYYFDGMHHRLIEKVDEIVSLIGPERTTEYGIEAAGLMLGSLEQTLATMDTPEGTWYASDSNRTLLVENIARLRAVTGM
jgi:hypothetical protein